MTERMSEAEVALRLAFWLIDTNLTLDEVQVAIDGAQVQVGATETFAIAQFLEEHNWTMTTRGNVSWHGDYKCARGTTLRIHSRPGSGDVVARLRDGRTLRAECKKGPLTRSKSSQEYPLIREALGQLITVNEAGESDLLAVAVPHAPRFEELCIKWRSAPLVKRLGIRLLTVSRNGEVRGL